MIKFRFMLFALYRSREARASEAEMSFSASDDDLTCPSNDQPSEMRSGLLIAIFI
jgi:hypothetical protein